MAGAHDLSADRQAMSADRQAISADRQAQNLMYYVYVITSQSQNYRYVGITDDIARRFRQHNKGYNRTTRPYIPFKLSLVEECKDRNIARAREKYYKSGFGREYLNRML